MKAVVCTKYGGPEVLKIQEIEKPSPTENEILVKIKVSSITTAESMMRQGTPKYARLFLGLTKPKSAITGTGYSGVVEAVGCKINNFKPGDEVFGETALGFGTNADYVCTSEDHLILHKPASLSFEKAAILCDGALTAANFLYKLAEIKPGQKVLINGAAGSIGSAATQIAANLGAKVSGVCSTKNIQFVQSLGAHQVIDYSQEDFTSLKNQYDVIFDTVGKSKYCDCRKALKPGGCYISPVLSLSLLMQVMFSGIFLSKKAKFTATGLKPVKELKPMLKDLLNLTERKSLDPVINQSFPFAHVVDAHRLVDTGHKRGNVVLVHSTN